MMYIKQKHISVVVLLKYRSEDLVVSDYSQSMTKNGSVWKLRIVARSPYPRFATEAQVAFHGSQLIISYQALEYDHEDLHHHYLCCSLCHLRRHRISLCG